MLLSKGAFNAKFNASIMCDTLAVSLLRYQNWTMHAMLVLTESVWMEQLLCFFRGLYAWFTMHVLARGGGGGGGGGGRGVEIDFHLNA